MNQSRKGSKIILFPAAKFCFLPQKATGPDRYDSDVKQVANAESKRVGQENEREMSECRDTENQE